MPSSTRCVGCRLFPARGRGVARTAFPRRAWERDEDGIGEMAVDERLLLFAAETEAMLQATDGHGGSASATPAHGRPMAAARASLPAMLGQSDDRIVKDPSRDPSPSSYIILLRSASHSAFRARVAGQRCEDADRADQSGRRGAEFVRARELLEHHVPGRGRGRLLAQRAGAKKTARKHPPTLPRSGSHHHAVSGILARRGSLDRAVVATGALQARRGYPCRPVLHL
jgi:hypothetical protein